MQNRRISSKILWTVIVPLVMGVIIVVISLGLEYRTGWFADNGKSAMVQPSVSTGNQYSQNKTILAGQTESFFDGKLTIEVINQNGERLVHKGYDVKVIASSPQGVRSETVHMGDCLVLGGFTASVGTVGFEGSLQKAGFLVTRLDDDADTSACIIQQDN